ncbi:MAG TPA: vWA domain-containing protein [Candidatus Saccharimonadales bacterium]|jgi:Ca-activated chloride channel family protein
MKLQPLVPLWLLIPYLLLTLGAAGWQVWRLRRKARPLLIRWCRRGLLLVLPAILALGPSVPGGSSAPGVANLDVIFAVDTTPSMGALDYNGTQPRMDGVKKDLLALAVKLRGAHLEIITFDSSANVILPSTTDPTAFATAVDGLTPQISSYSQGSSIDEPIDLITQELKDSKTAYPQRNRLVFYLGDGEQTTPTAVASFAPIAPYLNGGGVLGYGTTTGAKIPNETGLGTSSTTPYITTVNGTTNTLTPAVSVMSPTALQTIASQLKVTYRDRDTGGSVDNVYTASQAPLAIDRSQRVVHYLNLYWLLAIPFAIMLFWEWQMLIIRLFELRQGRGAKHA